MTTTTTPCSVVAHDEDCLCDVEVSTPTSIIPMDTSTTWGLKFALEAGHSLDDPESILRLLEALALAKDASVNMVGFTRRDGRGKIRASEELRQDLKRWISDGESIIDAPAHFHVSWADVLASLTAGKPSSLWSWSESMWAEVESFILSSDEWCGYRALMHEFGISRSNAQSLERLYRDSVRPISAEANAMIEERFIRSPRAKIQWLIGKLEQHGHVVSAEQALRVRRRLIERGLIPRYRNQTVEEWRQSLGKPTQQ